MPKRIFTQSGLLNSALVAAGVYLLGVVLLPQSVFIELLNGLFLGMIVAVTVVFFPLFWRSVRQRRFDRVAQLTIGIILTWLSLILSRSASTYSRILGDTSTMTGSHVVTLAAWLAIVGGILHVTAPGMLDDKLRYNRGLLLLAALIGVGVAAVAIILQRTPS